MKIFINQDSKKFVSSQKFNAVVNRFDFKRGDTHLIEIGFVENSLLVPLVGSFVITFALKESGKYDGSFLVSETNFVLNGSTGFFQGTPNFNTVELNDLLNANDGDDTNDIPYVDCLFEISVSDDNGISSSATSVGRVYHDVIKGDEGVPVSGTPVYPPASEITDHIADTANPHSVTAAQVGAVDLTTAQTVAGGKTFTDDIAVTGDLTVGGGTWDGATTTGAQTFTGQIEATGQAANTDDSVMTKDLQRILSASAYSMRSMPLHAWSETFTGSGASSSASAGALRIQTGSTTGSTALVRGNAGQLFHLCKMGEQLNVINWGSRFIVSFKIVGINLGANTEIRFSVGVANSSTTVGDLTEKGIGVFYDGTAVKLTVHDGTTLTTTGTLANVVDQKLTAFDIVSDGAGNAELFVNGVSVGTTTGAPAANSAVARTGVNVSCSNGVSTTNLIVDFSDSIKFLID